MRWWALWLLSGCGFEANTSGTVDAQIDAPADARAFDPSVDCPPSYDISLAGETSRYRMILPGANFGQHHAECAADQPGDTHLIALDTINEIVVAQAQVQTTTNLDEGCAWIGAVQLRDQLTDDAGWLKITGGTLTPMWTSGEPNDGGDNDEENDENFAMIAVNRSSQIDVTWTPTFGAMCECDGKPVDPTAAAAITASMQ